MLQIKDKLNRSIYILDNALSFAANEKLYEFVVKSMYTIGFEDTHAIERSTCKFLHSAWTPDDLYRSGFREALNNTEVWNIIKDLEVNRITINLSVPSDSYYPHCHPDEFSLVYYINYDWKVEWAGETLFYDENLQNIIYASPYTPRRLILMDPGIPHTIRPQSFLAPHYRFSLAMFFKK